MTQTEVSGFTFSNCNRQILYPCIYSFHSGTILYQTPILPLYSLLWFQTLIEKNMLKQISLKKICLENFIQVVLLGRFNSQVQVDFIQTECWGQISVTETSLPRFHLMLGQITSTQKLWVEFTQTEYLGRFHRHKKFGQISFKQNAGVDFIDINSLIDFIFMDIKTSLGRFYFNRYIFFFTPSQPRRLWVDFIDINSWADRFHLDRILAQISLSYKVWVDFT